MTAVQQYLEIINKRYKTGISREHSYRGDLQNLLTTIVPNDILVTNEPARIACGAPDYVLTKKDIPVGFIEAKDIGDSDLAGKKANKSQFNRYKASLNNLIFTDYLNFLLFIDGELKATIQIGEIQNGSIIPLPQHFEQFQSLIRDFSSHISQTIKSPLKLSKMMAGKAKMLAQVIENALTSDEETEQNSTLSDQMAAFKRILIHDITPKEFADIYAQTIAYGMFAARLHDESLDDFSRHEAASLIPKTNPFLRNLFQYISGYDIDNRIEWIVSSLADIFRATDVKSLLSTFGKTTRQNDPIIHFYETFLAEYDPKLRKSRGVWYTPEPVVNFIVRAVDDILKTEFGLPKGLADNSKIKVKRKVISKAEPGRRSKLKEVEIDHEVHRVQILDPATGTGTFLAEVVKHIYNQYFKAMQGAWSGYVEKDLIPRLNGFELLMASYAMAHLKMDLLLTETGFKPKNNQRFRIYLTNSLEESHPDTGTLFANWLSTEASEANHIKRDTPVMCVIGNPPYSGESANKGDWIMDLMEDYKKEPGGKVKLKERNPKWINDDYVKFMRYGQYFIEKNGEGILAFINPHGYLDNPTFRGMRWNLLKTYDKIYTIDLHGNSKKKETCPDGSPDINVFDIQQGVSINLFVKTGKKKKNELASFFHFDLYGKRELKYNFLWDNNLSSIDFNILPNKASMYYMVQKDFELEEAYEEGFRLKDLFKIDSMGVTSGNDQNFVKYYKNEFVDNLANTRFISPISYRPFDVRYIYYDPDMLARARADFMNNMIEQNNFGIALIRRSRNNQFNTPLITVGLIDKCIISTLDNANIFPLFIYEKNTGNLFNESNRIPNLNPNIISEISKKVSLNFSVEKELTANVFTPIDILDYIYAILHSPSYCKKYDEFLKIDFPTIPYPHNSKTFLHLVEFGKQLREVHLLESPKVEQYITTYPNDGDNIITRKMTQNSIGFEITDQAKGLGRVWINDEQYFDQVPLIAWEFYIGGYQPAQKWLKDRRDRELSFDDILHYQKIIVALTETDRLMKEIDKVEIE